MAGQPQPPFERFTDGARTAVVVSQEVARLQKTATIEPDHLALAMLRLEDDPGLVLVVRAVGLAPAELCAVIEAGLVTGTHVTDGAIPFGPPTKTILQRAIAMALAVGDDHVGVEHLLLGLVGHPDCPSAKALCAAGADRDAVLAAIRGREEPGFQVKTTRGLGRFRKGSRPPT